MPSRFDHPQGSSPNPKAQAPEDSAIEVGKRYDVYCHRHGHPSLMVYRNVVFKRVAPLTDQSDVYSRFGEFVELQSANGQTFFVSRMTIIAFCEHGSELPVESMKLE